MHKEDCPWKDGIEFYLYKENDYEEESLSISDSHMSHMVHKYRHEDEVTVYNFNFCPMCGEKL